MLGAKYLHISRRVPFRQNTTPHNQTIDGPSQFSRATLWSVVGPLSGAFAKLRIASISFVMSVRLSAWNNSAITGRIFMKFVI